MIDEVDRELQQWASSVVSDAEVFLAAPQPDSDSPSVSLHLLEIDNAPPTQRRGRRPLDIMLSYLVTTAAAAAEEAHRLLGLLVVSALERSDYQVELRQFAPQFWTAFNIAPRPAFILGRPMTIERATDAPLIRAPAEIRLALSTALSGVVLTSEDVPVPHARIELPSLNVSTYTDASGRFRLGAVPAAGMRESPLRVVAKGAEKVTTGKYEDDGGFVVRFDPKET